MAFGITFENKTSELKTTLTDLKIKVPEIESAAIVSIEGLPIASVLPQEIEEARLAAMTAAMLS
ncbi:MAG: roadblock/LC7 domain-containing protein, partial [Candidatus Heimdallarchaeaceae archaeon]